MKYIYMKRGQLSRIGRSERGYVCPASGPGLAIFSWASESVKIHVEHVDALQDGMSTRVFRRFESKFCIVLELYFWADLIFLLFVPSEETLFNRIFAHST